MENRSFMFLCFLKKHYWEQECQHSSLQLANKERQLSGNQEPSTSSEHLTGACYGWTNSPELWGPHSYKGWQMEHFTAGNTCPHPPTHTQGRQSWPGLVQLAWPSVNPEGELQGTQANSCLTYAETSMLLWRQLSVRCSVTHACWMLFARVLGEDAPASFLFSADLWLWVRTRPLESFLMSFN